MWTTSSSGCTRLPSARTNSSRITRCHALKVTRAERTSKNHPGSGYPLVGAAARLTVDGWSITSARVAANRAVDHVVRLSDVEKTLEGKVPIDDHLETTDEQAGSTIVDIETLEDSYATASFRKTLLLKYIKRALHTAASRTMEPTTSDLTRLKAALNCSRRLLVSYRARS